VKTLDEIVQTILANKRITKEEVKVLFDEYTLTCLKLNEAKSRIKTLEDTNEMLRTEVREFERHTGERLHMPGGQVIFQKIRG
jgi:hypothetical protein